MSHPGVLSLLLAGLAPEPDDGRPVDRDISHQEPQTASIICCGVELELPILKTDDFKSIDVLKERLLDEFEAHELNVFIAHSHAPWSPVKWAIGADVSIELERGIYGIEIRTCPFIEIPKSEFEKVFNILKNKLPQDVRFFKRCSTQIHFSIGKPDDEGVVQFPIDVAQRIIFCAIFFEEAIDDLMPAMTHNDDQDRPGGWKTNEYAKRNLLFNTDAVQVRSLGSIWATISKTESLEELRRLFINPSGAKGDKIFEHDKNFKWNVFANGGKTMEFRQPPPSREWKDVIAWVAFTRCFVRRAKNINPKVLDEASSGKSTFSEALGLETVAVQSNRDLEKEWVVLESELKNEQQDPPRVSIKQLEAFILVGDTADERPDFEHLKQRRDDMEQRLRKLKSKMIN
ncbi:hypothetical protein F5Y19DRAFT_484236 [Xylariaceae sp. FL1651]|nr:hypothetical protein F5Y19DRAFT_484236 [Xylariaceae sp. FL1651]